MVFPRDCPGFHKSIFFFEGVFKSFEVSFLEDRKINVWYLYIYQGDKFLLQI